MLGILKTKNPYEKSAKSTHSEILKHIRQESFYTELQVTDSFDGRFDLMLLHVFIVMHCLLHHEDKNTAEEFNQALFDATFADIDQTLREMGIGDMGVPKHMRKMMKAFNGRMQSYDVALAQGNLVEALSRNLYGTNPDISKDSLEEMVLYVQNALESLKQQGPQVILNGAVHFEKA